MIFVTGDIHGNPDRLSFKNWNKGKKLFKDDYLIILGDFGLIWCKNKKEKYWLDWLNDKPWTTLFVDGNHENFDRLYQYPVVKWKGGDISTIRSSIYWLRRGQVFEIENRNDSRKSPPEERGS